jgi:hypothetical protein
VIAAQSKADFQLREADSLRKALREIEIGIYPDYVEDDAESQASYKRYLEAELKEVMAQHLERLDALDAAKAARNRARELAAETVRSFVSGGNYQPDIKRGPSIKGYAKDELDAAETWLREFISAETVAAAGVDIYALPGVVRSAYFPSVHNIKMSPAAERGIYVHEIVHAIENKNQFIVDAALKFYRRRTQGFSQEPLRNYGAAYDTDEMTIVDHFKHPYIGKSDAEEILSMGVQMMYEDPIRFATEDPDYFAFIYDTFRGGGE